MRTASPDWAAAVTTIPAGVWMLIGLTVTFLGYRAPRRMALLLALWVAFAVVQVEGARSALRPGFRITGEERAMPDAVRVISLNCAGGSLDAAREVRQYAPDIVLLQESPTRMDTERLCEELFRSRGSAWCGPDASILARGKLRPAPHPRGTTNFVMARLPAPNADLTLVSLRLQPPLVRADIWNPECWRVHTDLRRSRRSELSELMRFVRRNAKDGPTIVGGDFNAGAADASLDLMRPFADSFDKAGRGWPDTAINDFPFARIDRIYISASVTALASCVRKTVHSDHRMLVVDLHLGDAESAGVRGD